MNKLTANQQERTYRLHEVLRDALRYLDMAEKDPDITVNMGYWFDWLDEDRTRCSVCLAGAYFCEGVINPELSLRMHSDDADDYATSAKLKSINSLRTGYLTDALDFLGIIPNEPAPPFVVCNYGKDAVQFKRDMNKILEYLVSQDY